MVNTKAKIKKTQTFLSDQQSTQSAALIGSNDALLTEILLRFPVTSILRFKSVSKHWRFLLIDRHFTHRYDKLLKSPVFITTGNIYVSYDVENGSAPPFRSLDFCFDSRGIRIVQSCNGLLLCCNDRGDTGDREHYVFNPTTKQLALIPSVPGGYNARKTISFMGLAFHETGCVHYKVVCIRSLKLDGDLFQIQIYSSDTRKWKICTEEAFCTDSFFFSNGGYWNGAIHWATSYGNHFYFKIETEQLQTLPLPVEMSACETMAMYFGESRGHLHLIISANYNGRGTGIQLNVYVSDYSEWFVKYQVQLDELLVAFPELFDYPCDYDFKVIDVVRGEEEEDTIMVLIIMPEKFIRFNVHDKSLKKIFNFTGSLPSFGRKLMVISKPCLLSR